MKKISLLFIALTISLTGMSQKMNVENTILELRDNDLADAKKYIDIAVNNPTTAEDSRMWYYRGKTYLKISLNKEMTDAEPEPAKEAIRSFKKFFDNEDREKRYVDDARSEFMNSALVAFNKGVQAYQSGDQKTAMEYYTAVTEAFPYDKEGMLKRNNLSEEVVYQYMAYSAQEGGNTAKAIEYNNKLIEMGFDDKGLYVNQSGLYLNQGDTAKALEVVEKGRELFPDNADLMTTQLYLYQSMGRSAELMAKLQEAVEIDPYNASMWFNLGVMQDQTGNRKEAMESYKKAIEMNPANADAHFNLGLIHYNDAADVVRKYNALTLEEYKKTGEKLKAEIQAGFEKARPSFEAAHDVIPTDVDIMKALKNLYVQLKMNDKVEEMDVRIAEAQKAKKK